MPWRKRVGDLALLGGALLLGCSPSADDAKTVSLPAFSFLPPWPATGSGDEAKLERLIARSVWAVVPERDSPASSDGTVLGSSVAVSGETLLASCDVAAADSRVGVERRSTYRSVEVKDTAHSGRLCELRPADVWLRTVAGYRPYETVPIGEPVFAVVSQTSRSFALVRGAVVGKGPADDPFLETSVVLPPGTHSAALFDRSGHLIGFGSAGPVGDAVVLAVPILPEAAPWLMQAHALQAVVDAVPGAPARTSMEDGP